MIKVHIEEGGWYGDCTLEGDYVSLHRDQFIIVNGDKIELPGENVLFLVCKNYNNQILLAGQGHLSGKTWLYRDNQWWSIGQSFATFPCAFGASALYFVSSANRYRTYDLQTGIVSDEISRVIGSNGIHYIDFSQSVDGIVTGDNVYYSPNYQLSEYTKRGDVLVGQNHEEPEGAIAFYGQRYRVEKGNCRFIRFYREANRICLAIVRPDDPSTVFYWMETSDLKLFPLADKAKEIPKEKPKEIPKEEPKTPEKGKKMSKDKDKVRADIDELIRFYNEPDGLNRRARGIPSPVVFNDPAITDWFTQAVMDDVEVIKNRIRQFPEYQEQHKGSSKPNPQ